MKISLFLICGVALGTLSAQEPVTGIPAAPSVNTDPVAKETAMASEKELIRKQELVFKATQSLSEADAAESAKDYLKAKQLYLGALSTLSPAPATKEPYDKAVSGLVRTNNVLIKAALAKGDRDGMEVLLQNSLTYDPTNKLLLEQMAQIQASKKNPNDTTFFGNPAVTPQFVKKVDTVQSLFEEAEQYRRTGQYDEAQARLKKILGIDPYNEAAYKQLAKIVKEKQAYTEIARVEARNRHLLDSEEKWANPVKRETIDINPSSVNTPITRSNQFEINQKIKSIILPSVDFTEQPLQDAINFLTARSKDLDPEKVGINFIPRAEAIESAKPITLSMKNVPMIEALRYITLLAGVKYKIDQAGIFIVPIAEVTEVLVRRTFPVPPNFFPVTSSGGGGGGAAQVGLRPSAAAASAISTTGSSSATDQLKDRGVQFSAPGSGAIYLAGQGVLQVVNTQDQMDLIEELVNAESGQTLLVDVEAKLIEINQQDLNDLTVNSSLNIINNLTPAQVLQSPQFTTALRGNSGFSTSNLDSLLGLNSTPVASRFELTGMYDGRTYSAVLTALAQKSSADLLSSPSIKVRSGDKATVDISRTFYYPVSFRAPELVKFQNPGGGGNGGTVVITDSPPAAIPAFPETFEKEEIGVIMNVQPTVGADNRTIDLSLVPEVTDFEGFINYGTPILVPNSAGVQKLLTVNDIPQAVFNTRRVTTKVLVRDGYTIMLGGIIREDVQTIKDRVPILGDIPIIGRLFQSKADKRIKKNLLIFVTAKIVRPDGEPFNLPPVAPSGTSVSAR